VTESPDESATDPHQEYAPLPLGKLPGQLLHRLIATYAGRPDASVVVGPGRGRDAAVVQPDGALIAAKTDPITFASQSAAAYLVDVNSNDLACLGATPRWLLVTALLPQGKTSEPDVERQFRELSEICAARDISLVGGHTEITPAVNWPVLVGTLLGVVTAGSLLKPGGAQVGDRLLLTKGIAIEGTALLARELSDKLTPVLGKDLVDRAAHLLLSPGISVVQDARTLLRAGGITALHDPTEGGLATAAQELASAAGHGVILDETAIPILAETRAITACLGLDPLGLLASGSLLAAATPVAAYDIIAAALGQGIAVSDIGVVVSDDVALLRRASGDIVPLPEFSSDEVTRALS
jgi:hydrogenase expression/formation protein HypE